VSRRRKGLIIAIDGPAGVGKSTIGGLLAKSLGYQFINTGEMYRALTWKALEEGLDLDDAAGVLALAKGLKWEFKPVEEGGTTLKTYIDGVPVTMQIREERVSVNSSRVAANPGVRKFLSKLQRDLGEDGAIVMEGRDITTHVFPTPTRRSTSTPARGARLPPLPSAQGGRPGGGPRRDPLRDPQARPQRPQARDQPLEAGARRARHRLDSADHAPGRRQDPAPRAARGEEWPMSDFDSPFRRFSEAAVYATLRAIWGVR